MTSGDAPDRNAWAAPHLFHQDSLPLPDDGIRDADFVSLTYIFRAQNFFASSMLEQEYTTADSREQATFQRWRKPRLSASYENIRDRTFGDLSPLVGQETIVAATFARLFSCLHVWTTVRRLMAVPGMT